MTVPATSAASCFKRFSIRMPSSSSSTCDSNISCILEAIESQSASALLKAMRAASFDFSTITRLSLTLSALSKSSLSHASSNSFSSSLYLVDAILTSSAACLLL
eukprot:Gb_04127 [translate_table: standard]